MEKRVLNSSRLYRYAGIAFVIVALSSCSVARVYVGVVQARNDYSGGDFQGANRKLVSLTRAGAFEPWISYNIGTVYYALGEPAAAEELWSADSGEVSTELAVLREFNLGVLAYERGSYEESYERFVRVLQLDPSLVEAKINLEFAFEKIEDQNELKKAPVPDGNSAADPGSDVHRLLQYLERLEQNVWQSTEYVEEEGGVNDW